MKPSRSFIILLISSVLVIAATVPYKGLQWKSLAQTSGLIAGRNVNMVSGTKLPGGDPWLQKQNEPSIAVSTRNTMHLLAGANDYRTVDMAIPEETLPGLPEGAAARDAWLSVFKSYDGGESWTSTLLPGFPQDSPCNSPLCGYDAAADPMVRAGTSGWFYYSGIAFDRVENGRSVVFLSRFRDNNDFEKTGGQYDPIKYIDTKIIDQGTSGQFTDKPFLAVDAPRGTSTSMTMGAQSVPCGNVYLAYTVFTGDLTKNVSSKIMIIKSTNCGETWDRPLKVSESHHINQGTAIGIDPQTGHIYVTWRRFARSGDPHMILMSKSTDGGRSFSKAIEVAIINDPFDQPSTDALTSPPDGTSFRVNSYPTIAVDSGRKIYIAWSERLPGDFARIVFTKSNDYGATWSSPARIHSLSSSDDWNAEGHQFMPSMTFAANRLLIVWYDQRDDISDCLNEPWISDASNCEYRHTTDIRAAQLELGNGQFFSPSIRVSRYMHYLKEEGGVWKAEQILYNFVNLPLFKEGTTPFNGDYIDIAPSPMFVRDDNGSWQFNTNQRPISYYHAAWTDNRDVVFSPDQNWVNFTPPNSTQDPEFESRVGCTGDPGIRNQNVYTSRLSAGTVIIAPGNVKTLGSTEGGKVYSRTFVVSLTNTTGGSNVYQLTLTPQIHEQNNEVVMEASFDQFSEVGAPLDEVSVEVNPYSSASLTVFVKVFDSAFEKAWVKVEVTSGSLYDFIYLNPDPGNPDLKDPDTQQPLELEYHTPNIINTYVNPNIINPNIINPNIINPNIINTAYVNPNIINPNIINPNIINQTIINPNIINPNIINTSLNGEVSGAEWEVTNTGNTTSSYTFQPYSNSDFPGYSGDPNSALVGQILVYRVHANPFAQNCNLKEAEHHELITNVSNPNIINPNIINANSVSDEPLYSEGDATFYLPPGGKAKVLMLIFDPNTGDDIGFDFGTQGALNISGGVVQHAVDSDAELNEQSQPPVASLIVYTTRLPDGIVGQAYPDVALEAFGGNDDSYTWSIISGELPAGLELDESGSGQIVNNPNPTQAGDYTLTVQVEDADGNTAQKLLTIRIGEPLQITTTSLPSGFPGKAYEAAVEAEGGVGDLTWSVESGVLPGGLSIGDSDGKISGVIDSNVSVGLHPFTIKITDSSYPSPYSEILSLSINIIAMQAQVGNPAFFGRGFGNDEAADVAVMNGDIYVSGRSAGDGTDYDYATVKYSSNLEESTSNWPKFYDANAFLDEATAVCASDGYIYVTGNSLEKETGSGNDIVTIKYGPEGTTYEWIARYDGPSHLGDIATAITYDNRHVYVTGYTYRGNKTAHSDYIVLKYDKTTGDLVWAETYDSRRNGNDESLAIAVLDEFVYITGRSEESLEDDGSITYDYFTVKYDSSGKVKWEQRYEGPPNGHHEAKALAVNDNGVFVTGSSKGVGTGYDYYTVKYDIGTGEIIWQAKYDGPAQADDKATGIALSGDFVYVTGTSSNGSNSDYLTVRYPQVLPDSGNPDDLEEDWVFRFDGFENGHDYAVGILAISGFVYVTGYSSNGSNDDILTLKLNSVDGSLSWIGIFDNANYDDIATAMIKDSSSIYITGYSYNGADNDFVTIKYNQ